MKVIRAHHLGMCFGVRDALDLAERESRRGPVTILGELVHNEVVLRGLKSQGVALARFPDEVRTATVMVTAHGASQRRVNDLQSRGFQVVEATCPLVASAHRALRELVEQGCHPVVIGRPDHVEVQGLTGDCEEFDVILNPDDVARLLARPRFGVVAQTTQPLVRVESLVRLMRQTFPNSEIRFVDTVCHPTKQRQAGAEEIARAADVVVVVGGAQSNNTKELVATCRKECRRVHHVQSAENLDLDWFVETDVVGLTAGTSTLDSTVDEVEHWLTQAFRAVTHA